MVYGSYDDFKLVLKNATTRTPASAAARPEDRLSPGAAAVEAHLEHGVEHEVNVTGGPFQFGRPWAPT